MSLWTNGLNHTNPYLIVSRTDVERVDYNGKYLHDASFTSTRYLSFDSTSVSADKSVERNWRQQCSH